MHWPKEAHRFIAPPYERAAWVGSAEESLVGHIALHGPGGDPAFDHAREVTGLSDDRLASVASLYHRRCATRESAQPCCSTGSAEASASPIATRRSAAMPRGSVSVFLDLTPDIELLCIVTVRVARPLCRITPRLAAPKSADGATDTATSQTSEAGTRPPSSVRQVELRSRIDARCIDSSTRVAFPSRVACCRRAGLPEVPHRTGSSPKPAGAVEYGPISFSIDRRSRPLSAAPRLLASDESPECVQRGVPVSA